MRVCVWWWWAGGGDVRADLGLFREVVEVLVAPLRGAVDDDEPVVAPPRVMHKHRQTDSHTHSSRSSSSAWGWGSRPDGIAQGGGHALGIVVVFLHEWRMGGGLGDQHGGSPANSVACIE